MGGCCSCDESQQITWVCGSFHHSLQISIKTESRGAEDTGGYCVRHTPPLTSPCPLYPLHHHPPLTPELLPYNALNFSVSTHIDFFIMLSWSPSMADPRYSYLLHHSTPLHLYFFKYFYNNFPDWTETRPVTRTRQWVTAFIMWYSVNSLLLQTINCYNNSPQTAW